MKHFLRSIAAVLTLLVLTSVPALAGQVSISVAASLKDALNEIVGVYAKSHPGATFQKNYAASGALAGQIEQGAPADLFISANVKWMNYLKEKNLVDAPSIRTFAFNDLVFAGATSQKIKSMNDLTRLGKIGIGSPKSVPAGEYAMQAIVKSGLEQALAGKLIMAKDVRESLMYAELGEVDGSVVYRTDALMAKKARILFTVPATLYPEVVYPVALTVAGAKNADAKSFHAWLKGKEATAILKKYGFTVK
ncbi:molybdate ABC transporter substrate-binding protein [Chlorobaculum sp. 24CR]|uniref:molybdate ABC transporter substrate-binding protein n=1 Tax=Chlorobaculum sp. 24CR TaxID=2508878 RepID=UPI00100B2778|nr:molybdate ABC transporter substrate-binding protein [Chlorobaculum sp. 24CR]RXK84726.1 molybdate ABC transporter substrate-binding protein [Chlorobaculum sp. 24CR]